MQKYITLDNNNYVQSVSDTAQEGSMAVEVNGYQAQLLGFITNKIFWDKNANALKFPADYPATDEKKIEMKYKGSLDDIKEHNAELSNQLNDLQNRFKESENSNATLKQQLEAAQTDAQTKDQQINDLNTRIGQLMVSMAGKSTAQGGNK
ncbi:hypothetical protein [Apilactobacillus micheneri]|uniref:hypothetical protein n=1 Tax=Apilactobacillus micheneri TaxID=1899430 RepID=UPI000D02A5FF|nr:hypothetical protein [Apilactobacillus micheneri]